MMYEFSKVTDVLAGCKHSTVMNLDQLDYTDDMIIKINIDTLLLHLYN